MRLRFRGRELDWHHIQKRWVALIAEIATYRKAQVIGAVRDRPSGNQRRLCAPILIACGRCHEISGAIVRQ